MKIGIAGPISVRFLAGYVENGNKLPECYSFPQTALLAHGLLQRGHQLSVYASDPETRHTIVFRGTRLNIHVCPMRARARDRALDFFKVERDHLIKAMTEDPCEVIHANWTYEFAMAALVSKQPCVITARDAPYTVLRHLPDAYRFIRLLMAYYVALHAQVLVANSPYTARHFRKFMLYFKPISVIPNAFPDGLFKHTDVQSRGENRALSFASILTGWGRMKNSVSLLEAFSIVHRAIPESHLLLFGECHGEGEIAHKWAKSRQWDNNVTFAGKTSYYELMKRLRTEADIYVHPAREESFGNAVVEAMAQGIPVIGGVNSGAVPWLLDHGKAGVLTDVSDPNKMAQAMIALAHDDKRRTELGKVGWSRAYNNFHLEEILDRYLNIYQGAIKKAS